MYTLVLTIYLGVKNLKLISARNVGNFKSELNFFKNSNIGYLVGNRLLKLIFIIIFPLILSQTIHEDLMKKT